MGKRQGKGGGRGEGRRGEKLIGREWRGGEDTRKEKKNREKEQTGPFFLKEGHCFKKRGKKSKKKWGGVDTP